MSDMKPSLGKSQKAEAVQKMDDLLTHISTLEADPTISLVSRSRTQIHCQVSIFLTFFLPQTSDDRVKPTHKVKVQ